MWDLIPPKCLDEPSLVSKEIAITWHGPAKLTLFAHASASATEWLRNLVPSRLLLMQSVLIMSSAAGNVSEFDDAGLRVYAGLRGLTQVYAGLRVYACLRVYAGLQVCWAKRCLRCVVVLSCLRHQEGIVSHLCRTAVACFSYNFFEFRLSFLYGVMADNPSKD